MLADRTQRWPSKGIVPSGPSARRSSSSSSGLGDDDEVPLRNAFLYGHCKAAVIMHIAASEGFHEYVDRLQLSPNQECRQERARAWVFCGIEAGVRIAGSL